MSLVSNRKLIDGRKLKGNTIRFFLLLQSLLFHPKFKGGPYKMLNINFVQSGSNFAQFTKIWNEQIAKIWSLSLNIN